MVAAALALACGLAVILYSGAQRRRFAAREAAEIRDREKRTRLPAEFAHYRERLEFVRERLATFIDDPSAPPDVDLDEWPRHAGDFAAILGVTSESYRALGAAHRGVTAVGRGLDPDRTEPVLHMVDRALEAVEEALGRVSGRRSV